MASKIGTFILALTLILASAQARTLKGSPICSGASEADHLVPHPTDCHLFYSCSEDGDGGYDAYLFSCPAGLAFDDTLNRCEFEESVPRCKQDSTTAAPTTTSVPTTTTETSTTTTEKEPVTTTEPETTTTSTTQKPETTTPEPETSTPEEPETSTPEEPETSTPEKPESTTTQAPLTTTTEEASSTESPVFESITCENKKGSIRCDDGKVVKVISGYYGRQDRKTCRHALIQSTSCHSNRLDYLQAECEGKHSCTFTSNNRFGDPCRYTYKYTEVHYQCI